MLREKNNMLSFFLKFWLRNLPRKLFTWASKNLVPPPRQTVILSRLEQLAVWPVLARRFSGPDAEFCGAPYKYINLLIVYRNLCFFLYYY
jgi:hypothetical protein